MGGAETCIRSPVLRDGRGRNTRGGHTGVKGGRQAGRKSSEGSNVRINLKMKRLWRFFFCLFVFVYFGGPDNGSRMRKCKEASSWLPSGVCRSLSPRYLILGEGGVGRGIEPTDVCLLH